MGVSTDGILAYGYDLGGPEEWKIEGLGEYGELTTPWYGEGDSDDDDSPDFGDAAETRLLAELAGFTETWEDAEAAGTTDTHFERKNEVEERLGVEIVTHCSLDYPMFILASRKVRAWRGDAKDVTEAVSADLTEDREHLARALAALGITPTQAEPCWLLASLWG